MTNPINTLETRYQVGSEVVQKYLTELWGGEISTVSHKPVFSATYPQQVLNLIEQCHSSGFPVVCDRLACGYYRVSLHGEDLGDWSELGVLGVLSGLRHKFYRERLAPSLASTAIPPVAEVPQETVAPQPESPELITRLAKLEGEELAQIQNWCKSVKGKMFPSVSQYADGRLELHLRRFVSLTGAKSGKKAEVKLIEPGRYAGADVIEELGEKLLPDFHQALVLFYES